VTTTIVFVRHGKADDVEGRCVGHFDAPLSEAGAAAIRNLATGLPGMRLSRLVSSDLARARDSAAILSEAVGIPVTLDPCLREMNFGSWDGRTWADIESTDGERCRAWMENWTTVAPPAGERLHDLVGRADSWIAELPGDETVLVVSHAGFIRAAVCRLLARPSETLFDLSIDHAHAIVIELGSRGAELLASNISSLVGPSARTKVGVRP
jgi:broad specificity phosphatase PhoE